MKFTTALGAIALTFCFSLPAFAQEPLSYQLTLSHEAQSPAKLRVQANEDLSKCQIKLSGCAKKGKPQVFNVSSIAASETKEFSWQQDEGIYQCKIKYRCMLPTRDKGAFFEAESQHEMRSIGPLSFEIDTRKLNPATAAIDFTSNRPINEIEYLIVAEDGSEIDSGNEKLQTPQAKNTLIWAKNDKTPALVSLKIMDGSGAWSSQQLFFLQIPHTDIVFDTAKANIRKDQEQYLYETRDKILEVLNTHHKVIMDLYIAGYTDTVGKADANIKLSRARAKSIAQWFKKSGIRLKIYYQGFGEKVLAVKTADETPEEKNRRAVYMLTNSPPESDNFPDPNWIQL
ncbi:MAG: OmpA family protein [Bradymonadales bacterium]|jgi:outer membrane protein OmpA-like peptidoglycan-associated protein